MYSLSSNFDFIPVILMQFDRILSMFTFLDVNSNKFFGILQSIQWILVTGLVTRDYWAGAVGVPIFVFLHTLMLLSIIELSQSLKSSRTLNAHCARIG